MSAPGRAGHASVTSRSGRHQLVEQGEYVLVSVRIAHRKHVRRMSTNHLGVAPGGDSPQTARQEIAAHTEPTVLECPRTSSDPALPTTFEA